MNESVLTESWFVWSLVLGVSFPLLAILLGEFVHRLERAGHAMAPTLAEVRNFVLPSLVVFLLVRRVLDYEEGHWVAQWTATVFWIFVIHSILSILNIVLFTEAEEGSWRAQVPALLRDLSRAVLVAIGIAFVLSRVWGADLSRLLTALGVGSVVLGLALQDTLGNMFSGVTLLFERPLRVGDWLEVDGKIGKVIEINWRAFHLRTFDGEFLIIPNLVLSRQVLTNYSYPDPEFTECMTFSFSYKDPPNEVKRVLREVADAVPGILPEPRPIVLTETFGNPQVTYKIKLKLDEYRSSEEVRDMMTTRLWYAAKRSGLELEPELPYPEILRLEDAASAERDAISTADVVERLAEIPVLSRVERKVLEELAHSVRIEEYGVGERLIRQGQVGRYFFILLSGEAIIEVRDKAGKDIEVARLGAGNFIGEMALLLNEPSSASVIARECVEVVAIAGAELHSLLEAAPELARRIGKAVEARRREARVREREKRNLEKAA